MSTEDSTPHPAQCPILLVDDRPDKRLALRAVLEPLGQEVVEAGSGEAALRQLLQRDFAVILLDVQMPGMDGFETAALVRRRPRSESTPIIFITAFSKAEADMSKGYSLGAVDYVFTPVVPEILRAKVSAFVELFRQREQLRQALEQNRLLAERLKQRATALEAANAGLEAFSSTVSHDLRAPLRRLDSFSKRLETDHAAALGAAGLDLLTRIRRAVGLMQQLIDDLLLLARVTQGELRRSAVDLGQLATGIARELQRSEPERQVTWVIPAGLSVQGDERLLRVALENLLGNAFKFTTRKERARIELGQIDAGGMPAFYVKDDGAGFDPALAHRLFAPFTRLHAQEEFPGTGIGLAIVQQVVQRHGGRVWASGAVGEGATVFFTLG